MYSLIYILEGSQPDHFLLYWLPCWSVTHFIAQWREQSVRHTGLPTLASSYLCQVAGVSVCMLCGVSGGSDLGVFPRTLISFKLPLQGMGTCWQNNEHTSSNVCSFFFCLFDTIAHCNLLSFILRHTNNEASYILKVEEYQYVSSKNCVMYLSF